MLRALFLKDVRLVRLLLWIALASPCVIFVLATTAFFSGLDSFIAQRSTTEIWAHVMSVTEAGNLAAAYILSGLVAGSLLTLEKQDLSIEFLSCLPPRRLHVLISKLLVIASFVFAEVLVFGMLNGILDRLFEATDNAALADNRLSMIDVFQLLIGCAGVSWMAASVARSPALPLLFGISAPAIVVPLTQFAIEWFEISIPYTETGDLVFFSLMLLGTAGLLMGSTVYLTRAEV
jgi:hypothetical protein